MPKKTSKNAPPVDVQPENFHPEANPIVDSPISETQPFTANEDAQKTVKSRNRISLTLGNDGLIDLTAMKTENLARAREFFADKRNLELLGLTTAQVAIIDEQTANGIIDMIATMETVLFVAAAKIDRDIASKHGQFSKEERAELLPPIQRLGAKYIPLAMLQYKDEFLLGFLLLTKTRVKLADAQAEQDARRKARTASNPAIDATPPIKSELATGEQPN